MNKKTPAQWPGLLFVRTASTNTAMLQAREQDDKQRDFKASFLAGHCPFVDTQLLRRGQFEDAKTIKHNKNRQINQYKRPRKRPLVYTTFCNYLREASVIAAVPARHRL